MRRRWPLGLALIALAGGLSLFYLTQGPSIEPRDLSRLEGDPGRGVYMARLAGCVACHTNAKEGGAVLAGGGPIQTDFGTFYGPNITPHPEDGIGNWSLEDFAAALTAGETPEGSSYYPAFPYDHYTKMAGQDIVDLWAGIRTVPAVAGEAPPHDLNIPFSFRPLAGIWRSIFLDPGPLEPIPGEEPEIARGRYLAEGPGHCGACHSPRNILGGIDRKRSYEGGEGPGGEKVPAISQKALNAANWAELDLAYALKTGVTPRGDVLGGTMAEVIRDGTKFWLEEDRLAIARFLLATRQGSED